MRALIAAAAALMLAGPALAGPVTLKANPVDVDGQVTFGDLFDGAGAVSGRVVGVRSGPSVVFEAGQLQTLHYLDYKRSIEQALRQAEPLAP